MDNIENHRDHLRRLCEEHKVEKMYLFGSALNEKFSDKSDVDFLVRFKSIDLEDYYDNYINFKENLERLLGRDIDLVEEQTLKNPVLIKSISLSKELLFKRP